MYRTKYVIAGKWVNKENTEDTFPITAENIKILVRDSNYEKENLTKGMLRLMPDKNFMDKLRLIIWEIIPKRRKMFTSRLCLEYSLKKQMKEIMEQRIV